MPKIGTYRESEIWNANYDSNTCKPRSTSPSKTQTRLTHAASVSTFLNRSLFSRIAYLSLSTHLVHPILLFQRCLYLPMRCSYMSQCNDSKHHRIDSHICMQSRLVVPCASSSVLRPHSSHQSEPTFLVHPPWRMHGHAWNRLIDTIRTTATLICMCVRAQPHCRHAAHVHSIRSSSRPHSQRDTLAPTCLATQLVARFASAYVHQALTNTSTLAPQSNHTPYKPATHFAYHGVESATRLPNGPTILN